ncbi:isoprenyl transferase [candidate division NPL-UPA2 bacterium]|nr:isoprenyl transferase [candidate division NPL-UPA2 bacterium]
MAEDQELVERLDRAKLPRHVAIIMDGNGRWAKDRGLPRIAGHREGVNSVREIVRISGDMGIEVLTLYAFSVENWKRPRRQVNALMRLLQEFLRKERLRLNKNRVKLKAIGRLKELPPGVQEALEMTIKSTAKNEGLLLNLALNYGGRNEIVDAARDLVSDVQKGIRRIEEINEETFPEYLYTSGLPDPDLLIRTSGEYRLSNFLLYQLSYSEIWFTLVHWPDFKRKHFLEALLDYQNRERRFGGS